VKGELQMTKIEELEKQIKTLVVDGDILLNAIKEECSKNNVIYENQLEDVIKLIDKTVMDFLNENVDCNE